MKDVLRRHWLFLVLFLVYHELACMQQSRDPTVPHVAAYGMLLDINVPLDPLQHTFTNHATLLYRDSLSVQAHVVPANIGFASAVSRVEDDEDAPSPRTMAAAVERLKRFTAETEEEALSGGDPYVDVFAERSEPTAPATEADCDVLLFGRVRFLSHPAAGRKAHQYSCKDVSMC